MSDDNNATESDEWAGADLTEEIFSPSVAFGLLADKTDRFTLYLLDARGGTVTIDELATHLAALENETVPSLITNEMQHRVRLNLVHAEIPKLSEHGLIEHDEDSGSVTISDDADKITPYLEFAKQHETEDVEEFLENCLR